MISYTVASAVPQLDLEKKRKKAGDLGLKSTIFFFNLRQVRSLCQNTYILIDASMVSKTCSSFKSHDCSHLLSTLANINNLQINIPLPGLNALHD